jgi:hypothetical protein
MGVTITMTDADAESVECYLRGAVEGATEIAEEEVLRMEKLLDRLRKKRIRAEAIRPRAHKGGQP